MGCPLQSRRKRVEEFKANPKWLKAWLRAGQRWWDTHEGIRCKAKFRDVYEVLYHELFCDSYAEYYQKFREGCLFDSEVKTAKQMLEEYFKIEL